MAVSDDDIIKRRLLLEGDGGVDDRRINNTLKMFIKWSNSSESPEDSNSTYQRLVGMLAQIEQSTDKSLEVYNMNLGEQENYEKLNQEIKDGLSSAYEKINECKDELKQAKRIRRNRQEYDALAKVIQQHPDRQDTLKRIEALDNELHSLREARESLEQKLDLRRKQFHVLITAIHEMQHILEEDEKGKEEEAAVMDTT